MNAVEQSKTFLIFWVLGIIIGVIFDIFRGFRKSFKCIDIIIYFQDILFIGLVRIFNF